MRAPKHFLDDLPATDPDFRFPLSEAPMPDLHWTTRAACRRPDLKGTELVEHVAAYYPAKGKVVDAALLECCRSCLVVAECGAFGARWNMPGIWGGRRQEERLAERRRLRRMKGAA